MSARTETRCPGVQLVETRTHSQLQRDREFGASYTDQRALRAFRSYRKLCEADKAARKMTEAERMYGERFDASLQIRRGKIVKAPPVEITDQEVPFECESYEDAASRVLELVGPVPPMVRNFHTARLNDNILKAVEYCGFSAALTEGVRQGFDVAWRLDFDPQKQSHFNVSVVPPKNGVDVSPLNVAFTFPYEEGQFLDIAEATCRKVAINTFTQPEDQIGYVPLSLPDVQRISGIVLPK